MDNHPPSRCGPASTPLRNTCKAHYWGLRNCNVHRHIPLSPPEGAFILFPKLPPELRRMIWRFALPTGQRIVHVQQKWIDYDMDGWFTERTRPTRTWKNEIGDILTLDAGTDAYGTKLKQGQLEKFGFTSSQPVPMLDEHERYTGYEYFHEYLDDKWLYSNCHSDVENLARTCSESRQAVKAKYELVFSNRFGPARTWFNFDTDVLYLGCDKFYFSSTFLHVPQSPFNMSIFNLKDLRRVKQLAVQYPRRYCVEYRHLEEAVKYAANLDHLYLVEGDSSEFDRSDLVLIQFDNAAAGRQYMHGSWNDRKRVEKYLQEIDENEIVYDSWMENVDTDLTEFYDECMDKGQPSFSIPGIELVSVVSRRDYQYLCHWTKAIEKTRDQKAFWAQERSMEDRFIQIEEKGCTPGTPMEHLMIELLDRRAARHMTQMANEAQDFDDAIAVLAQVAISRKGVEDLRMLSLYEEELEHEEKLAEFQSRNDEWLNTRSRAPRKKNEGTILGYFHHVREPEPNLDPNSFEFYMMNWDAEKLAERAAATEVSWGGEEWNSEVVALAGQHENEHEYAKWEAEQVALVKEHEDELADEADLYPDWFLLNVGKDMRL